MKNLILAQKKDSMRIECLTSAKESNNIVH